MPLGRDECVAGVIMAPLLRPEYGFACMGTVRCPTGVTGSLVRVEPRSRGPMSRHVAPASVVDIRAPEHSTHPLSVEAKLKAHLEKSPTALVCAMDRPLGVRFINFG